MDAEKIEQLKNFLDHCKSDPSVLHEPSLKFFKSYLESLGAQIPQNNPDSGADSQKPDLSDVKLEDDITEDMDLDESEVIEPEDDPPQKMGDPNVEVTEENMEAAQISKSKAMEAISEGKLDEATELLTEAIMLNPRSAILYAARASVFVKMNKPNSAIRDAEAALQINPDSAKGYKFRGIANARLGHWLASAKDLHVASNLDYDEEIGAILKKVEPNARKIEEFNKKHDRTKKERALRKADLERKQQQAAEAQAKYDREKKKQPPSDHKTTVPEGKSAPNEGHVISPHSAGEVDSKLAAASSLSRLLILYFTATWCGPCRFISPLYESLAGRYPKVVFMKIDIDKLRDVAARWNVSSVPTFFFIRNGTEIDKVIGADKDALERKITLHANQS